MANYLEHLLEKTKWALIINNENRLLYTQSCDYTCFIEVVKKGERLIEVSIPLNNMRPVQFRTRFFSEMQAYEYIEDHILSQQQQQQQQQQPHINLSNKEIQGVILE